MVEPIIYDKAKYHYDGDFPAELEIEQGFVHTGMFLGWIMDHALYSEWFGKELSGYVEAFKARDMTGAKVFEACDGVFMEDMLTDEGNGFAQHYFDFERGRYLHDYGELLGKGLPTIYHVTDRPPTLKAVISGSETAASGTTLVSSSGGELSSTTSRGTCSGTSNHPRLTASKSRGTSSLKSPGLISPCIPYRM